MFIKLFVCPLPTIWRRHSDDTETPHRRAAIGGWQSWRLITESGGSLLTSHTTYAFLNFVPVLSIIFNFNSLVANRYLHTLKHCTYKWLGNVDLTKFSESLPWHCLIDEGTLRITTSFHCGQGTFNGQNILIFRCESCEPASRLWDNPSQYTLNLPIHLSP